MKPANSNLTGLSSAHSSPVSDSCNRPPPRRSECLTVATLLSLIRCRSSPRRRRPRPPSAASGTPPSPASAAAQQLHLCEDRQVRSSHSSLALAASSKMWCRRSSLRAAAAFGVRRSCSNLPAMMRRFSSSFVAATSVAHGSSLVD